MRRSCPLPGTYGAELRIQVRPGLEEVFSPRDVTEAFGVYVAR
jgi:hypothetical protein